MVIDLCLLNLYDLINEHFEKLTLTDKHFFVTKICSALSYLHDQNIMHLVKS